MTDIGYLRGETIFSVLHRGIVPPLDTDTELWLHMKEMFSGISSVVEEVIKYNEKLRKSLPLWCI